MNVLLMIGLILICVGGGLAYWQYAMIVGKEVSEGRVTNLEPHPGSKGGTVYVLIAEFPDRQGQVHTYRSGFSSSAPGYKVGERIRIWFERSNPAQCGIMSFGYRFGIAWIVLVVGLAMVMVCYGFSAGNRWMGTRFPATVHGQ